MKKRTKRWHLRSAKISEFVHAPDQLAAWDTLRDRPVEDFGLVVEAEANEQGEGASVPVRTSMLMYRWGRVDDAKRFIARAIEEGLPDTTREDQAVARRARNA